MLQLVSSLTLGEENDNHFYAERKSIRKETNRGDFCLFEFLISWISKSHDFINNNFSLKDPSGMILERSDSILTVEDLL